MPVTEIKLRFVKAFIVENNKGETILVDAGTPGSGKKLREVLEQRGVLNRLRAVVFTHSHGDHIGGAPELGLKVPLLIHEDGEKFLREGRWRKPVIHSRLYRVGFSLLSLFIKDDGRPLQSVEKLKEGEIIEGVNVIYTPGHTSDSVTLHLPHENVVIVGDTLQGTGSGLRLPVIYEDKDQLLESVRRIASLNPQFVYVSHGTSGKPRWPDEIK
jgi:glyoxylase-like metal-dependent hydrolase (beta-lactamase superfamily II)